MCVLETRLVFFSARVFRVYSAVYLDPARITATGKTVRTDPVFALDLRSFFFFFAI